MRNSESLTRDWTLAELPIGVAARVVVVDQRRRAGLASHGIRPGVVVEVEVDAPFGGPRIIRLGFARLALARDIARAIRVRREIGADPAEPSP